MNHLANVKRLLFIAVAAFTICVLGACDAARSGKTVPAELTGYNHTDNTIGAFYVNGEWGGNITSGSGGGKFVCCVELPVPWHDGLTVRVKWEDHDGVIHERDVAVPQYDPRTLSTMNVHFLRSGEIKVFAVRMGLGHPDYPLKGEEAKLPPGIMDKRNAAYEAEQAVSAVSSADKTNAPQ